MLGNKHSTGWSGRDVRVEDTAARPQQSRQGRMFEERPRASAISRDHDRSTGGNRSNRSRELSQKRRIEPVTDHATETGNAENALSHE